MSNDFQSCAILPQRLDGGSSRARLAIAVQFYTDGDQPTN
jgi:hypothetical protein